MHSLALSPTGTDRLCWRQERTDGFPDGAGLSGHAVLSLEQPNNSYMVFGREGSLRTQRRSGSAWLLRGAPGQGFRYEQLSLACASRSGHCAVAIAPSRLLVLGGRDNNLVSDFVFVYSTAVILVLVRHVYLSVTASLLRQVEEHRLAAQCRAQLPRCAIVSQLLAASSKGSKQNSRAATAGRRDAVALATAGGALLFGGFGFNAGPASQEARSDFVLISSDQVGVVALSPMNYIPVLPSLLIFVYWSRGNLQCDTCGSHEGVIRPPSGDLSIV